MAKWSESFEAADGDAPVLPRRHVRDDAELDITPMIDITFLLLIFFLVASRPTAEKWVDLPPARYGAGISQKESVIITVAEPGGDTPAPVYLADGRSGDPLPEDEDAQFEEIVRYVEEALLGAKSQVLIKAERKVRHRDVTRVAQAVSQVEGVRLYVAVAETE